MIKITNYKEMIRTSNDDGTDRVEIIGCKVTDNGREFEANIIFPKVKEAEPLAAIEDYEEEIFSIYVPD